MKYNNLKQAHTNTRYKILEKKLYCGIRNVPEVFEVEVILKSKKCETLKKDVLDIALDQRNERVRP